MDLLRELLKKKMQIKSGLLPKRSYPPPDFWNFWDTFLYADFFPGTFGALFVLYFTKIVGAQKVSQNFWIALDPPPLLEEVHN